MTGGCGSPGASTLGRLLLLVVLLSPPSTLLLFLLSTRSPGLAGGRSSCRGVGDCSSCCDAGGGGGGGGGGGLRWACRNCTASSSMDDSCCRSFGSRGIRAIQLLIRRMASIASCTVEMMWVYNGRGRRDEINNPNAYGPTPLF